MHVQLTRKPFGEYTLLTLGNEETHISFIPERSAYIHQVRLNGRDLLWNYASGPELTENSAYRNLALLPFPNRTYEGTYEWKGKRSSFAVNNPVSGSALHGFGPDVEFSVERYDLTGHRATVKLSYLHRKHATPESYPFQLKFEVVLEVDVQAQTASWQLSATNLSSENVPVGLGWHPYFLLPGGHANWKIQLPPNDQVVLAKAIPTGVISKGLPSKQAAPINVNWDDCFVLTDPNDLEVKLNGPDYSLSLKQIGTTRYTQLYVPGDNESVAVEPMTCGVNAFNISQEEVALGIDETITTGMVISLI